MRAQPTILVTDSMFIFPEHEQQLASAGYRVERLDKAMASEAELIAAVKGKAGYILGGVEKITDKVIDSADSLRAIVFTGADWKGYVPGYQSAHSKGIVIANALGANSAAVAEYTVTLILIRLRSVLELGISGEVGFRTTQSVYSSPIGIVGLGKIGLIVAKLLKGLGAQNVSYWNRTRKLDIEHELGIKYKPLNELFKTSRVITNHLSGDAGQLITRRLIDSTQDGTIFINTGSDKSYDMDALLERLKLGKAVAAFDDNIKDKRFTSLPLSRWFQSNECAAFNTLDANKLSSDMVTDSMINLLTTGQDKHRVL